MLLPKGASVSSRRESEAVQFAVRIRHLPTHRRVGDVTVAANFCVDPAGHVADVTMTGGDNDTRALALKALKAVPFTPRGSNAAPNVRGLLIGEPGPSGGTYQPLLSVTSIGYFMGRPEASLPASTPMWSCGLMTRVHVYSKPVNDTIAKIDRAWFHSLSAEPPTR